MRSLSIIALVVLSAACMQKSADGTYHVKKNDAEVKTDARKLGKEIEQKTADATRKAGAAIQRAGERMKADAQKRH